MEYIQEPSRSTPVIAETEVLVVGSGPAGLAAAIAAAREGVKTMLVERYGCFGGAITQVGVNSIAWYRYEDTIDVEGIGIEFERRAAELDRSGITPFERSYLIDTELFKYLADQLVQEADIEPLLHCYTVDTIMEGRTIKGIIIESKSGRQAILANRVIDATGDAGSVHLELIMPNLWQNYISQDVRILAAFTPVDEENTILYLRFYQWFLSLPVLGKIVAQLAMPSNLYIARQDRRVVNTHRIKASSMELGEKLIQGDLPIIQFRRRRAELQRLASLPEASL
jgi:hypothetical protein